MPEGIPFAYFITFTCFGARLHGDQKGYVDRNHNDFDTSYPEASATLLSQCEARMKNDKYVLNKTKRSIVLHEIIKTCQHFDWVLLAAHVRSNHVHVILRSDLDPEKIMTKLKGYISRKLNLAFTDEANIKKWTRHGSTKRLWSAIVADAAIDYVLFQQGNPMACYENKAQRINEDDF